LFNWLFCDVDLSRKAVRGEIAMEPCTLSRGEVPKGTWPLIEGASLTVEVVENVRPWSIGLTSLSRLSTECLFNWLFCEVDLSRKAERGEPVMEPCTLLEGVPRIDEFVEYLRCSRLRSHVFTSNRSEALLNWLACEGNLSRAGERDGDPNESCPLNEGAPLIVELVE
jgi:hypothetical protein